MEKYGSGEQQSEPGRPEHTGRRRDQLRALMPDDDADGVCTPVTDDDAGNTVHDTATAYCVFG